MDEYIKGGGCRAIADSQVDSIILQNGLVLGCCVGPQVARHEVDYESELKNITKRNELVSSKKCLYYSYLPLYIGSFVPD